MSFLFKKTSNFVQNLKPLHLVLILFLIALSLRVLFIDKLPEGFQGDEAAFGYYAYSILHEGTDEFGNKFPLYFESIGDYKYPMYVYLSIPFVAIFGLSEFSTRFLSALSGSLTVVVLFYLILLLSKNKLLALSTSLLLVLSSWHIFFSRGAFESTLALFFSTFSIYAFLKFYENSKYKWIAFSFLAFIAAIFSYSPHRIFLPLMILSVTVIKYFSQKSTSKKRLLTNFSFGIIILVISLLSFIPAESRARAGGIFGGGERILNVTHQDLILGDGVLNPGQTFYSRLFHNQYTEFSLNYLAKYLKQFDFEYLFINGDKTRTMYNIPNTGLLYFFELLLLPAGLLFLLSKNKQLFFIFLFWILIGALPSSLTAEQPSSVRMLMSVVGFAAFSGSGLYYFFTLLFPSKIKKILPLVIGLIFIFYNFGYVFHQYTVHATIFRAWHRDVGVKEMVQKVTELEKNYQSVFIPKDPYIFFLFYNKILPSQFLPQAVILPGGVGNWERVEKFGKINFKMEVNCPSKGKLNILYVCTGGNIPKNAQLVYITRFADKTPAYFLIEFQEPLSKETPTPPPPEGLEYTFGSGEILPPEHGDFY